MVASVQPGTRAVTIGAWAQRRCAGLSWLLLVVLAKRGKKAAEPREGRVPVPIADAIDIELSGGVSIRVDCVAALANSCTNSVSFLWKVSGPDCTGPETLF